MNCECICRDMTCHVRERMPRRGRVSANMTDLSVLNGFFEFGERFPLPSRERVRVRGALQTPSSDTDANSFGELAFILQLLNRELPMTQRYLLFYSGSDCSQP